MWHTISSAPDIHAVHPIDGLEGSLGSHRHRRGIPLHQLGELSKDAEVAASGSVTEQEVLSG